jgi:hypothetical protein
MSLVIRFLLTICKLQSCKRDRLDKRCGDGAVFVNKHIHAERIHDLEVRGLESV